MSFTFSRRGAGRLSSLCAAVILSVAGSAAFAQDIRPGTLVRRGEEIGQVGSTGFSTGPHLHFEIRKQGQYIDPANKQSQLRFWQLAEQEQSQAVSRLMRLQITPSTAPVVVEASRGPRPD